MNNDLGFIRIGCISPELKLADIKGNADVLIESAVKAAREGCDIAVFP